MARIDQWLWAARFFKTRSLAKKQVEQGKVKINGQKCKPSREVKTNDTLLINKNDLLWEVSVLELAEKRVSAHIAQTFYQETESSKKMREKTIELKHLSFHSNPKSAGRPTKKQRRDLKKLKSHQQES